MNNKKTKQRFKNGEFFIAPKFLIQDLNINVRWRILFYMLDQRDGWQASERKLADDLGVTRQSIHKELTWLTKIGYITRNAKRNDFKSVTYSLSLKPTNQQKNKKRGGRKATSSCGGGGNYGLPIDCQLEVASTGNYGLPMLSTTSCLSRQLEVAFPIPNTNTKYQKDLPISKNFQNNQQYLNIKTQKMLNYETIVKKKKGLYQELEISDYGNIETFLEETSKIQPKTEDGRLIPEKLDFKSFESIGAPTYYYSYILAKQNGKIGIVTQEYFYPIKENSVKPVLKAWNYEYNKHYNAKICFEIFTPGKEPLSPNLEIFSKNDELIVLSKEYGVQIPSKEDQERAQHDFLEQNKKNSPYKK